MTSTVASKATEVSRAEVRARQCDLFEAADRPTLTGATGAHAWTRRLRAECSPRLTTRNETDRSQMLASISTRNSTRAKS